MVELTVFDIAGRAVRRLVDYTLAAGSHRAHWDGTDARGARARAGTYFVRLRSAGPEAVRTIVLH